MPAQGKVHPVTSMQFVGPRLSEAQLLNAGRLLATQLPIPAGRHPHGEAPDPSK